MYATEFAPATSSSGRVIEVDDCELFDETGDGAVMRIRPLRMMDNLGIFNFSQLLRVPTTYLV